MKSYLLSAVVAICLISCKQTSSEDEQEMAVLETAQQEYESFGEKITPNNALSAEEMREKYAGMKAGDTIQVKFETTVNSVCKMKGCWMTLDLPETDDDPMVKFKDYAFFVPKDIEGANVIVEGKAFIEETSIEDQKHFAKDAGKTKEEIAAISESKRAMSFLAHGVLLKQ